MDLVQFKRDFSELGAADQINIIYLSLGTMALQLERDGVMDGTELIARFDIETRRLRLYMSKEIRENDEMED